MEHTETHPVISRCRIGCGFAVGYPEALAAAAQAVLVEHERTHLVIEDPVETLVCRS